MKNTIKYAIAFMFLFSSLISNASESNKELLGSCDLGSYYYEEGKILFKKADSEEFDRIGSGWGKIQDTAVYKNKLVILSQDGTLFLKDQDSSKKIGQSFSPSKIKVVADAIFLLNNKGELLAKINDGEDNWSYTFMGIIDLDEEKHSQISSFELRSNHVVVLILSDDSRENKTLKLPEAFSLMSQDDSRSSFQRLRDSISTSTISIGATVIGVVAIAASVYFRLRR